MVNAMNSIPSSTPSRILKRVRAKGRGAVFTCADFADQGGRSAVDAALSRLVAAGRLRRLAQGLYDYPRMSIRLGPLSPAPDKIAQALARSSGARLQIDGAAAANGLGVTTQVPAKTVYLTDGPARQVRMGRQTVTLKRVSPRNLPAPGRAAGDTFQAIRWLGKDGVTPDVIDTLQRALGPADKADLRKLAPRAPGWIRPVLQQIAG